MSSQHCTGERGVSRIFGEDCSCMAETLQHKLKTLNYKVIRPKTENINNIFLIFSATFPMFLVRDFSVFSISSFFVVFDNYCSCCLSGEVLLVEYILNSLLVFAG